MFLFYSVTFFMVVAFPVSLRILMIVPWKFLLATPLPWHILISVNCFFLLVYFFLFHFKVFLKGLVVVAV